MSLVSHALRRTCPACGKASIFTGWNELVENCPQCGLVIRAREPDTYFFMYMSTAAITGIFVGSLLLLSPPENRFITSIAIGIGALVLFLITTPIRKSIAIAIEYYTDTRSQHPKFPIGKP